MLHELLEVEVSSSSPSVTLRRALSLASGTILRPLSVAEGCAPLRK